MAPEWASSSAVLSAATQLAATEAATAAPAFARQETSPLRHRGDTAARTVQLRRGVAPRERQRHRRPGWQEQLREQAWRRVVAGSALVTVSGALGLAGLAHPAVLPSWGAGPAAVASPLARASGTTAQPALVAQDGAAVPLDAALSVLAPGGTAGAGTAIPEAGQGLSALSNGRHVLTPQIAAAKEYARSRLRDYGWTDPKEMVCLDRLWTRESGWQWNATNPGSGAYGIPQSLPASKLASAGPDWRTNPRTQIDWGLEYIYQRYGSPSQAWAHSEATGWY